MDVYVKLDMFFKDGEIRKLNAPTAENNEKSSWENWKEGLRSLIEEALKKSPYDVKNTEVMLILGDL